MRRLRIRTGDEQGAILLLALGFITFVGVVAVALLSYATTNLRASSTLQTLRSRQFSADGAVDLAINSIRTAGNAGFATHSCNTGSYGPITLNGLPYRVSCTAGTSNANFADVTFLACQRSAGSCPVGEAVLVAKVHYLWTTTPATTQVTAWSVKK